MKRIVIAFLLLISFSFLLIAKDKKETDPEKNINNIVSRLDSIALTTICLTVQLNYDEARINSLQSYINYLTDKHNNALTTTTEQDWANYSALVTKETEAKNLVDSVVKIKNDNSLDTTTKSTRIIAVLAGSNQIN
jgi:hypothetical protein